MYWSKLRAAFFTISFIFLFVFYSPLVGMEGGSSSTSITELNVERHDPPFFLIKLPDGRLIYILGALHSIPINMALSPQTLEELERVAKIETPILLTEHSATNTVNLEHMPKAKIGMSESWMNEHKHKGIIPKEGFQQLFKLVKDKIFIDMIHSSNIEISALLTLDPWLAAPILQMHIGVLYKKKFGGFEHDLENSEPWKSYWKAIRFLETHETLLDISHHNAEQDYVENLKWINSSLRLALIISTFDESSQAQEAIKNERLRDIGYYIWNHINDTERYETSIERNKAWVIKTHEELKGSDKVFLIVIGTAHLSGQENFLSLLLKSFSDSQIELMRYSNKDGWIHFEYKH